jgi:hypothetical protein
VAAYGLSFVFAKSGGNYLLLFGVGAGAMMLALATDLLAAVIGEPSEEHPRPRAS